MREQRLYSKPSRFRIAAALLLLISSIVISVSFSLLSQQGSLYWVAKTPLLPGTQIQSSSLELRKVSLGSSSHLYFGRNDSPALLTSKRFFSPGEVISRAGVSSRVENEFVVSVPISVRSVDIPESAEPGDMVTLFWVLDGRGDQLFEPEEIAREIYIQSIDRRGSNFGSDLAISVSVSHSQVQKLLSYTTGGRIVVVPSHA